MANLNVKAAMGTVASPAFIKSAILVVLGSLLAQMATGYLRSNVYDVEFAGGDAIYSVVAGLLAIMILPSKYGKPMALGSTATAVRVVVRELGLL